MKSFKNWNRQDVQEVFGVKRVEELPLLEEWLSADTSNITSKSKEQLESLQVLLRRHALDWNEAELKFHFLGPLMNIVDFHSKDYHSFVERSLEVKVGEKTAYGKVDFMVASGEQVPKAPYFCLHEYKPEEGVSHDASGQLLIAMVAAQQANLKLVGDIPIFGAFVIGRNFYFMVLEGKNYAFSDVYPATQEDLFHIFAILRKVKDYIDEQIQRTTLQ